MRDNFSDELLSMWRTQADHWKSEWLRYGKPEDVNALHLSLCHHLHGEVDELLRCADWKIHAAGEMADKSRITFECVDIWKFLLTMLLIHDVTPGEFAKAFHEKSRVVTGRVKLERLRTMPGPLFICDIDGILCDRDTELLKFARGGEPEPPPGAVVWRTISEYKCTFGQAAYEHLKGKFYESGGFLHCEPYHENVRALAPLFDRVPILLVTSRDIARYPHLEAETYDWLDRWGVPFDGLIFASEKERALTWVDRHSVAIDDEQEHADKLLLVCEAERYTGPESLAKAVTLALDAKRLHDERKRDAARS